MCKVLEVSRSGYYKWLKRRESESAQRRRQLLQRILEIHEEYRRTYGSPRMWEQLRKEGYGCSLRFVAELMRKHEIAAKQKRKYKATTNSKHNLPVAPNVLGRQFTSEEPDEVWVSDITYIATGQGWLYLCVFIDLYSRMVVGWSLSERMTANLVVNAFEAGISNRGRPPIVVHSDQGSQYASWLFSGLLIDYGCVQSMSRKGNCWDNAVAESFFGSLKNELIYCESYATRIQACMAVSEYIESFYNKRRLHSVLGYLTPWEKVQKDRKVA